MFLQIPRVPKFAQLVEILLQNYYHPKAWRPLMVWIFGQNETKLLNKIKDWALVQTHNRLSKIWMKK